jgi:transcriptional regulator with XRE-family HTH domain
MKRRSGTRKLADGVASFSVEKQPSSFAVNLRRLISFHHPSAREAAKILGVSEHAMSAWLTEKRKPGLDSIMRIAGLYDIDPRLLSGDPLAFARDLADPARIKNAEANILHPAHPVGAVTPFRRKHDRAEVEETPSRPQPTTKGRKS